MYVGLEAVHFWRSLYFHFDIKLCTDLRQKWVMGDLSVEHSLSLQSLPVCELQSVWNVCRRGDSPILRPADFYRLFSGHSDSINAVPTKHWHFYGKLQSFDLDHKMNPFFWVIVVSKSDKPWTALYQFKEKWPGLSARDKILAANKAF